MVIAASWAVAHRGQLSTLYLSHPPGSHVGCTCSHTYRADCFDDHAAAHWEAYVSPCPYSPVRGRAGHSSYRAAHWADQCGAVYGPHGGSTTRSPLSPFSVSRSL